MTVTEGPRVGSVVISGDGCVDAPVRITLRGSEVGPTYVEILDQLETTPEADGTWSVTWSTTAIAFAVDVIADCGDVGDDGFRYRTQFWYQSGYNDLWIGRTSPTSSPVGGV